MDQNLPFSVKILNIMKFDLNIDSTVVHERVSTDYELDYYMGGKRSMTINGQKFSIEAGSVIFRRPGDHSVSRGAYNCYTLTLDFSGKKEHLCGRYDRNDPANAMQETVKDRFLDLIPSHFVSRNPSEYVRIYDQLCYHFQSVSSQSAGDVLLHQLLFLVLSDVFHKRYNEQESSHESRILTKTCRYIQENFHRDLSIKELAENVSFSPSYFFKIFKRAANTTPAEYLISVRLSNAKQLLLESDLTVAEIAEACGFHDASYFSYYFKKSFGMTPSSYRLQKEGTAE